MKSLTEEERQNLKEEKARYKKIIVDTLADKLSDFVEEKKKKEGITNNEMADLMKIEQGQLSKVLNSGTELGISSLVRIAKYFNVSTDYLLGLSYLQSTDEQYKATHALTGLSDKAIEKLNNLLKETKNEIGLKEVAIDNTKTINYLLEAEDEYHILSIMPLRSGFFTAAFSAVEPSQQSQRDHRHAANQEIGQTSGSGHNRRLRRGQRTGGNQGIRR